VLLVPTATCSAGGGEGDATCTDQFEAFEQSGDGVGGGGEVAQPGQAPPERYCSSISAIRERISAAVPASSIRPRRIT